MPRFYKKGKLGRMIEAEGGSSDPELAEVRMTDEEYWDLWDQIRSSKRVAESALAEGEKQKNEAWRQANRAVERARSEADAEAKRKIAIAQQSAAENAEQASALRERLERTEADLKKAKDLHANLIRIMRERANQARNIKPKKDHDGYVVLESRQWTERYTEDIWDTDEHKKQYGNDSDRKLAIEDGYLRVERKNADVWRSIMQTPYNSSLPIEQIQGRIASEIGVVLADIGVETRLKAEYNGKYYDFGTNDDGRKKNGMYRWTYKANYRSGLWELEFFTTGGLLVPEYRRPVQRTKG